MRFIKKIKGSVWAFIIPIIFLILWLFTNSILGSKYNAIVVSDMYHQYIALFGQLKEMVTGGSFFYSFNKGLGGNMTGTIAYYLLSPFNIITLFFSEAQMHYASIVLILVKLGLCGTTMFIFLKNWFKKLNLLPLLMFSTCYALMMFNIGYYFNVMWLDGVLLVPIVLLGLDKLIAGKKPIIYGIFLFLAVFINYYIGYIICLFATIYFFYKLFLKYKWHNDKKIIIKTSLNFIIISILSCLIAMFILAPMALELSETPRSVGSAFSIPIKFDFDIIKLISDFFIGITRKNEILNPNSFFIYTGIINFILVIFYFFNKNFSRREKVLSLIVLGIFIISFMCNYANYIWHGLAAPNSFNGRYTFLFSLYLIYLGCRTFLNLDGIKKTTYFALAPIFPIIGLITYIRGSIDIQYVYISVGLYFLYLLLLYLIAHREGIEKKQLIIMVVGIVISELFFNAYADLSHYTLIRNKMIEGKYSDYKELVNFVHDYDHSSFYRMEFDTHVTHNDPLYFNYYGASLFLSSTNKRLADFYTNVGCFSTGANLTYSCYSYMMDALLNIKYIGKLGTEEERYKTIKEEDVKEGEGPLYGVFEEKMTIYQNPYALSLGFMVDKNVLIFDDEYKKLDDNSLNYQNLIYKLMNKEGKNILKPIPLEKNDNYTYSLTNSDNKDFYMAINYENLVLGQNIKIDLNEEWMKWKVYSPHANYYFKNVFDKNERITVKINLLENMEEIPKVSFYYFDYDAFQDIINELKQESLNIIVNKEYYLKGEIDVKEDNRILFTSIPYEKGWTVKVDGQTVPHYALFDTFIGVNLNDGHHTVELEFNPPGLKTGLIISGISLILFITYLIYYHKINRFIFKESDN